MYKIGTIIRVCKSVDNGMNHFQNGDIVEIYGVDTFSIRGLHYLCHDINEPKNAMYWLYDEQIGEIVNMNIKERLSQVDKDIELLQEEKKRIEEEVKKDEEIKFGDVIVCDNGKRIALYDEYGNLFAFSVGLSLIHKNLIKHCPVEDSVHYKKVGVNIFTNGCLDAVLNK